MWHEARKQERLIRGMIVDYRRRAERRRDFYEKIKADPTQFLQIHGRPCKIHLDPAVAAAGDSPAIMMPWQGDASNLIDRFDVRAHLDFIPDIKIPEVPVEELSQDERHCNYESYRILAQNSFLGINEDKFLHQLEIDEQFGVTVDEKEQQREKNTEKKGTGAAIAYSYSDTSTPSTSAGEVKVKDAVEAEDSAEDSDMELMDVDLSIDVNKVEPQQAHALNLHGPSFGMAGCDFFSFLTGDADDAESERQLMLEEREKALYSGRKSRRERRAHRDKKQSMRVLSPPSYAAAPTPAEREPTRSPSRSRSASPAQPTTIQFITSFGGEDEEEKKIEPVRKPLYADKVKQKSGPRMEKTFASAVKEGPQRYKRSVTPRRTWESRRRSPSPRPYRRTRSRSPLSSSLTSSSVSRSRSRSKTRRSRSRSSGSRSKSSRSRSRSRRRNSRSPSNLKESKTETVPLPRYYGRRKAEKDSSSELSVDSSDSSDDTNATDKNDVTVGGGKSSSNQNSQRGVANKGGKTGGSGDALSLKERLRKKMQAQLSRQLRADQRAQAERQEREQQLQQEREDEMRELAIRMRRRQREMRHKSESRNSNSSRSERSASETRSIDSTRVKERSRGRDRTPSRSRSRSISPAEPPRKIAVWESDKDKQTDSQLYDVNTPPPGFRKRPAKSIFDKIPRKEPVWETNPDFEMNTKYDSESRQFEHSKYANREEGHDRNRVWESQGNYIDRQNASSSSVTQNRGPKDRKVPAVWEAEQPYNRNVRPSRPSLLGNQPDGYDPVKNQNYREGNFDLRRNFRNEDRFKGGQSNSWGTSNSRGKSYYKGDRRDEMYDNQYRRNAAGNEKQEKKLVDY